MKSITIRQPWASLIVHGIKDIENRTWACPKKYIGKRVLIHASASSWIWNRVLNYINFVNKKLLPVFIKLGYNGAWLRGLPTGAIIGSVQIVDCVQNHSSIWAEKSMESKCPNCQRIIKRHFNEDYFFCEHCGRKCIKGLHYDKPVYNWVLANPVLFEKPIPAKGKLSFWDFDGIKEVKIECPECGSTEIAIEDYTTAPFATYLHSCNKCGHVIMESEWEVINKEE